MYNSRARHVRPVLLDAPRDDDLYPLLWNFITPNKQHPGGHSHPYTVCIPAGSDLRGPAAPAG